MRDAILLGLILASFIMVLFLRDWGTSLVAGLVIPATIGVTCIALRALGQSFNLMTLGGLAAAVGLVIDDAIVVVENIVLHRDTGQPRAEAIRSAIREIRVPLVGSTITPIVVFLPLISITGVTGVFFRALAITVGVALFTSLALALTWTPTLSHYFLRSRKGGGVRKHDTVPPWMMRSYERTLRYTLEHPLVLALLAVVLIAGSWLCYTRTGSDLLPAMDEGGFIVDYIMPPGSSLRETNRVIGQIEKVLRDTPDVATTARRTGLQLGLAAVTEANQGDISVKLKPMASFWTRLFGTASKNQRTRPGDEVIADVRAKINEIAPALDVEFPQLLQDMIGDLTSAPQPVVIKLFSEDPELLRHWAPLEASTIRKDSRCGRCRKWNREHHERHRCCIQRRSGGRRPSGLHASGSRVGCERDAAGRARHHSNRPERKVIYDPRSVPALRAPDARKHAKDGDRQRYRQNRYHRLACHPDRDPRPDGNHPRQPATMCQRNGSA